MVRSCSVCAGKSRVSNLSLFAKVYIRKQASSSVLGTARIASDKTGANKAKAARFMTLLFPRPSRSQFKLLWAETTGCSLRTTWPSEKPWRRLKTMRLPVFA
jgi:hypothetical protein